MTTQSWVMYLCMVIIATATPGPAVLFITTNTLLHGCKKSIYAALGNIVGLFCLGGIAISGLGAILKTSVIVFNVVKYAGAIYLIYLGMKMICQKGNNDELVKPLSSACGVSPQKLFLQAVGVALSNPKAVVFLTALFPQFIDVNTPLMSQFMTLILVLMLFSFSFLMLYALMAYRAKKWLTKPGRIGAVQRTSGSMFVGFGILMATSSNK